MKRFDPRRELLIVIGMLTTLAGMGSGLMAVVPLGLHDVPGRKLFLFPIAALVLIAGIGLTLLRRWAGIAVAALSIIVSAGYTIAILRDGVTGGALFLNLLLVSVFVALPSIAIVRWRRFLR